MISEKDKKDIMVDYIINQLYSLRINKSRNYDKTKDSDYRNPIYCPKRKKYGKR